MSRTLVHSFSISLDGFGTGEDLSAQAPFGHAGHRLPPEYVPRAVAWLKAHLR